MWVPDVTLSLWSWGMNMGCGAVQERPLMSVSDCQSRRPVLALETLSSWKMVSTLWCLSENMLQPSGLALGKPRWPAWPPPPPGTFWPTTPRAISCIGPQLEPRSVERFTTCAE